MPRLVLILCISALLCGCFPKNAGSSLSHFANEAPAVGEAAPTFSLKDLDGNSIELASLIGDKPIVLQLGSHTCPVYRYRRFGMAKLYNEYAEKAHFLLIYTLEAHPIGAINPYVDREWVSSFNYLTNTLLKKHGNEQERTAAATSSTAKLSVAYPVVVDNMNDEIWRAYGRAPSAAFVIDTSGRIARRMPWVNPTAIAETLDSLIGEKSPDSK